MNEKELEEEIRRLKKWFHEQLAEKEKVIEELRRTNMMTLRSALTEADRRAELEEELRKLEKNARKKSA